MKEIIYARMFFLFWLVVLSTACEQVIPVAPAAPMYVYSVCFARVAKYFLVSDSLLWPGQSFV